MVLQKASSSLDSLYEKLSLRLSRGERQAVRSINATMVATYWLMGHDIVEEEQKGEDRAAYGSYLIKGVSERLTKEFGPRFGLSTMKDIRQFYLKYPDAFSIGHTVRGQFETRAISCFPLSWSHYRLLMRVADLSRRSFYEKEAIQNNWSARELERQINSLLFDRLAKSKDKEGLLRLAQEGHIIENPRDTIKDPYILEFLGIPEAAKMNEGDLESALITNLQSFLLELGKGFAFVARQKRLTLEGDHFYADLIFYHTILKCYIIIDLKMGKLTHSDLGQMQLYVHYYDQEKRHEGDNPTLGLVICTDKNDSMVKYTLGTQENQIFTSTYQLHLPTEAELRDEIMREKASLQNHLFGKEAQV